MKVREDDEEEKAGGMKMESSCYNVFLDLKITHTGA